MRLSFAVAVFFYLAGLLLSLVNLRSRKESLSQTAFGALVVGFLFHTVFLVLLAADDRRLPIYTSREACSLFAWLISCS